MTILFVERSIEIDASPERVWDVRLSTAHGDFAKLAGGDALHPRVVELWERLLPHIEQLAESGIEA